MPFAHTHVQRLREHAYNVSSMISGQLGIHCRDCRCQPQFQLCETVKRHWDQLTREILEAKNRKIRQHVCQQSFCCFIKKGDQFFGRLIGLLVFCAFVLCFLGWFSFFPILNCAYIYCTVASNKIQLRVSTLPVSSFIQFVVFLSCFYLLSVSNQLAQASTLVVFSSKFISSVVAT